MTSRRVYAGINRRRRMACGVAMALCGGIGLGLIMQANLRAQQEERYREPRKLAVRLNRLIERLEQGYVAFSGVDYQWVDLEHSPFDTARLRERVTEMRKDRNEKGQVRLPPIVRIPAEGDQEVRWIVKQVLEAGPFGVIFPHVKNAEEALKAVKAVRYPQRKDSKYPFPNGVRGHGCGVNCGDRTWGLRMDEYMYRADAWPLNPEGELFVMVMIESGEAVANIHDILDVPGISAVFIGPSDLSLEMTGRPFRAWHWPDNKQPQVVQAAIDTVLNACKAKNKICGMAAQTGLGREATEARTQELIRQGWRVLLQAPLPREACTLPSPQC